MQVPKGVSMIELDPIIPKQVFDSEAYIRFLDKLLRAAVEKMHNVLKTYPAYKYVPWDGQVPWVSEKQRRYVIANIRKGIIQIPYRRTDSLSKSWQVRPAHTKDALTYILGTNHPKAKYVQGDQQHSRMRIIGHWTTDKVAKEIWPKEANKIEKTANTFAPLYKAYHFFTGG